MRLKAIFSLILISLVYIGLARQTQPTGGVPKDLLSKIDRGVNVTRWFCYLRDPADMTHYADYFTGEDVRALHRLGVHFIRLCVSPDCIYDNGVPNVQRAPVLEQHVADLAADGFAVIIDLHDNGTMKVDTPGQDNSGFVSFWRRMAQQYRGQLEHSVVFELLNEPVFRDHPDVWYTLQEEAVRAIREEDPRRTIMVTSTSWSSIDTLVAMTPLAEKNLIYTFHCYDPFFFTHQGASWAGPEPRDFKNMPFPSSPEAVAKIIEDIPEQYRNTVKWYGDQRFDDAYLLGRMQKAVEWGHVNHVFVVLGEFGSYPLVSPPDSRARWFTGMRKALAQLNVPNALWGYDDALGLGRTVGPDGLKLDQLVIDNLYK